MAVFVHMHYYYNFAWACVTIKLITLTETIDYCRYGATTLGLLFSWLHNYICCTAQYLYITWALFPIKLLLCAYDTMLIQFFYC